MGLVLNVPGTRSKPSEVGARTKKKAPILRNPSGASGGRSSRALRDGTGHRFTGKHKDNMEHWSYGTDDDETHEASTRAYEWKLQKHLQAQSSAGSSSGGSTTPCAVTNAPGDQSWWQLVPDPQKAQPLPRTYQHKQPAGCAPGLEEGEIQTQGHDDEGQDPKLPPGVIDISEELRERHRERQRDDQWARSVIVKCLALGAGTQQGPIHNSESLPSDATRGNTTRNDARNAHGPPARDRNDVQRHCNEPGWWHAPGQMSAGTQQGTEHGSETPPRDAAHEKTTREGRREAHGPPSRDRSSVQRHRDASSSWFAPRPQRLPCLEHPSDGLAGPHQGSTRHRGGVGPYHLRKERPHWGETPNTRGRLNVSPTDHRFQYSHGSTSAAWHTYGPRRAYERRRAPPSIRRE